MSETKYEAGYAVPLKGFSYDRKSLEEISSNFGKQPSSFYEECGEITDFEFEDFKIYKGKNGLWLCFEKNDDDYSLDFFSSISEIDAEASKLAKIFGVAREDVRVYAHDWYTGCDNPFVYREIV
jgi:hypothetical protein